MAEVVDGTPNSQTSSDSEQDGASLVAVVPVDDLNEAKWAGAALRCLPLEAQSRKRIKFACPTCQTKLRIANTKAGAEIDCPRCSQRLIVPTPSSVPKLGIVREDSFHIGPPLLPVIPTSPTVKDWLPDWLPDSFSINSPPPHPSKPDEQDIPPLELTMTDTTNSFSAPEALERIEDRKDASSGPQPADDHNFRGRTPKRVYKEDELDFADSPRLARFNCPFCGSRRPPVRHSKVSGGGWAVAVVLFLCTIILFWIGFFFRDHYHRCRDCGVRLG